MHLKKASFQLPFPSPFEIALWLTFLSLLLATALTKPLEDKYSVYFLEVLGFWRTGFWELLEFTLQMVLILVFGHALALAPQVKRNLHRLSALPKNQVQAVLLVGGMSILGGYFNWGFGLILGAILAKDVGTMAAARQMPLNYPLVAASGYLGMMVWHGGLSGSAPLKVAEEGHFLVGEIGVIPVAETIFSPFNLMINAILVIALLCMLFMMAKQNKNSGSIKLKDQKFVSEPKDKGMGGFWMGLLMLVTGLAAIFLDNNKDLGWINLNYINFMLFAMGLMAHQSLGRYGKAVKTALGGASGIILQFPFYAGILGIFKYSGLLALVAGYFIQVSTPQTFPIFTFFSASILNLFIPSGGGQWAIQGPVMVEAAKNLGLDVPKMIMVMAYGDQVSNMLQPFWALPLMAITGVPGKAILKYTFVFFLMGSLVFIGSILFLF